MWHEARKHEKKLRVFIVDYRRRAERRREFYEKFKADPTQFMQVHGRPCKIHMDPQISAAAENSLMPWQADPEVKIDRCDARALLDRIPEYHPSSQDNAAAVEIDDQETELNYERYRILIQNEISAISEDKFLHQIHVEEQFGTPLGVKGNAVAAKAQPKAPKAAIAYNYDNGPQVKQHQQQQQPAANEEEEESDDDLDFDLLVNMQDLTGAQQNELNVSGVKYGMRQYDFMKFLNADLEEKEHQRLAKLAEEEKQTMSGRKARRERRAFKDRIILRKGYISPPSYAAKDTQKQEEEEASSSGSSRSRSASAEKITYITSFGGNENNDGKRSGNKSGLIFGPSLPPASSSKIKKRKLSKSPPRRRSYVSRSRSRDRSNVTKSRRRSSSSSSDGASKVRRRRMRSRSRSRSYDRKKHSSKRKSPTRSRSSSKSRRRNRKRKSSSSSSSSSSSRSRSRSGTPKKYKRRSRNHSRSYSRSPKGRRDRSPRRSPPAKRYSPKSTVKTTASPAASNGESSRLPSPPVKRYYDRAKAVAKESSDDELMPSSDSDDAGKQQKYKSKVSGHTSSGKTHTGTTSKGLASSSGPKLTPQERLKRRMQQALSRSLKEDKEAEMQREQQREQERMEREESLRELSIKYRRRERVKRHQEHRDSDSSYSSSRSRSRSSSRSRSPSRYRN